MASKTPGLREGRPYWETDNEWYEARLVWDEFLKEQDVYFARLSEMREYSADWLGKIVDVEAMEKSPYGLLGGKKVHRELKPESRRPLYEASMMAYGYLLFGSKFGFEKKKVEEGVSATEYKAISRIFFVWDFSESNLWSMDEPASYISIPWAGVNIYKSTGYTLGTFIAYLVVSDAMRNDYYIHTIVYPAATVEARLGNNPNRGCPTKSGWYPSKSGERVEVENVFHISNLLGVNVGVSWSLHFSGSRDYDKVMRRLLGLPHYHKSVEDPVENMKPVFALLFREVSEAPSQVRHKIIWVSDANEDRYEIEGGYYDYMYLFPKLADMADIYFIHISTNEEFGKRFVKDASRPDGTPSFRYVQVSNANKVDVIKQLSEYFQQHSRKKI